LRLLIFIALIFFQHNCMAQMIDPATLTSIEAGQTLVLDKPFSYSTRFDNNVTVTFKVKAGSYKAELLGEIGTFYRGSKNCLSRSSYTPRAGLGGDGVYGASKADCGILVLKTGGAMIYFYESTKGKQMRASRACSNCNQMPLEVKKLLEQSIGKIYFAHNMQPSVELESKLLSR